MTRGSLLPQRRLLLTTPTQQRRADKKATKQAFKDEEKLHVKASAAQGSLGSVVRM